MQTNVNIELLRNNALFTLSRKKFSNSKRIKASQIQTDATDKTRVKGSKVILVAPELDAIHKALDELYLWISARCVPSFFKDGLYLAKAELAGEFNAKCDQFKTVTLPPLVEELQFQYQARKDQAREALGPLYDESDYPDVRNLAECFGVTYHWFNISIPENLTAEIQATEARKLEEKFQQAEIEIMAALREGFGEVIEHVTERLTAAPGEKPKTFRDSLFEELTSFIGTFNARNILNDKDLGAMVNKAQNILATVRGDGTGEKAQIIRDSRMLRDQTAKAFADLKASVDASITAIPSRKMRLDD